MEQLDHYLEQALLTEGVIIHFKKVLKDDKKKLFDDVKNQFKEIHRPIEQDTTDKIKERWNEIEAILKTDDVRVNFNNDLSKILSITKKVA